MTIKLKAPVIWLEKDDTILHGFMSKRLTERERKYRIVSDSDWRKLMALVKLVEGHVTGGDVSFHDLYDAFKELEKKK